jgi:hypothetical protein
MDSPENLCDLHWELWFTEGYENYCSVEDMVRMRQFDLNDAWKRHGRPDDAEDQLSEIEKITRQSA